MTPLRQRMTEDMRLRNLGLSTQRAYLQYVAQFGKTVCLPSGPGWLVLECAR